MNRTLTSAILTALLITSAFGSQSRQPNFSGTWVLDKSGSEGLPPGTEQMIESIRTRCGTKQIPRQRAAREGLAALRRNEILAILLDQNTAEGGVFVPFFGMG